MLDRERKKRISKKCRFRAIFIYAWIIQLCIKLCTIVFMKNLKAGTNTQQRQKKVCCFAFESIFFFLLSSLVLLQLLLLSSSSLTLDRHYKSANKTFQNEQTNKQEPKNWWRRLERTKKNERDKIISDLSEEINESESVKEEPKFFKQINKAVKKTIM